MGIENTVREAHTKLLARSQNARSRMTFLEYVVLGITVVCLIILGAYYSIYLLTKQIYTQIDRKEKDQ